VVVAASKNIFVYYQQIFVLNKHMVKL